MVDGSPGVVLPAAETDDEKTAAEERKENIVWDLQQRGTMAWERYHAFRAEPGNRCPDCWLIWRYCCCGELQGIRLRQRVVVVWHYAELDRRRGSNTAKLLVQFGADMLVWGIKEHEEKLRLLLEAERDHAVILFPAPGAVQASEMARGCPGWPERARCIVVLDGGWKETRKMNQAIDQRVARCCVSSASHEGITRKYKQGKHGRAQTASAFVALMTELGAEEAVVAELRGGLTSFLAAYERQLQWSGVALSSRNTRHVENLCDEVDDRRLGVSHAADEGNVSSSS